MSASQKSRFGRIASRRAEGQLSEMLALIFRVEPDIAVEFVRTWGGSGFRNTTGTYKIETEVSTDTGKFIDLELCSRDPERILLWIEIKRDLPGESYEGQVASYLKILSAKCEEEGYKGCVVYLPRPGVLDPSPECPPNVAYVATDWTKVGKWLEAWAASKKLVADFLLFLEEEALYVTRIKRSEIEALGTSSPQRFASLIGEVRDRVAESVRDRPEVMNSGISFEPKQPNTWVMNWGGRTHATYPLDAEFKGDDWAILLEWNLRSREEGPFLGQVVFAAGLTWYGPRGKTWGTIESGLIRSFDEAGVEPFSPYEDDLPRLFRWLDPADLAEPDDFEGQVGALTSFVSGAFDDVLAGLVRIRSLD